MTEMTKPTRRRGRNDELVDVYIGNVPAPLRRALDQAANDADLSINAVATMALAEEFGVPYESPGRRSQGKRSTRDFLYLTMPRRLRQKLNEQRARTEVPVSDIVTAVLSRKFLA